MQTWLRSAVAFVVSWSALLPMAAAESSAPISYSRDIQPLLSNACFRCHGFDEATRAAGLRLDTADGARDILTADGDEPSELWRRISTDDPDQVMPPAAELHQLSAADKDLIRRWIEQGAQYEDHWAFVAPQAAPPPAANDQWPDWQQPIDRFLLQAIQQNRLQPRPRADRETLVRRVAFALTGLPPTADEIDQFLYDEAEDAYQRMVDRYLQSTAYGEEMARHWLDIARYGDTHGMHLDNVRDIWPYRDWVVEAFNRNQSFDQFTVEQLAGDLIPSATQSQLVATGFNRCNMTTGEGGAINEEFLYRYAVERASTTFSAFLGLTGGCAVCHDHKYDPISAREFYSLYAFFYSAADPAMDGNQAKTPPYLDLPSEQQSAELMRLQSIEAVALRRLNAAAAAAAAAATIDQPASSDQPTAAAPAVYDVWLDDTMPMGSGRDNTSRNAETWVSSDDLAVPLGQRALRMAYGDLHTQNIRSGTVPRPIPQTPELHVWVLVDPLHPPAAFAVELDTVGEGGSQTHRYAWGDVAALRRGAFDDPRNVRVGDSPESGQWQRLVVPTDRIAMPVGATVETIRLVLFGGVIHWDGLAISGSAPTDSDPRVSLENWLAYGAGRDIPAIAGDVAASIKTPPADDQPRSDEQLLAIRTIFLQHIARDLPLPLQRARSDWQAVTTAIETLRSEIPGSLIFGELPTPRQAHVMLRGQYDAIGEAVQPAVPDCLPPLVIEDPQQRLTRLDLANWLVQPDHPLTSRVAVNRFWQQVFGIGFVDTPDDFGTQGSTPTHPELLDWLSVDFVQSGWDVRRLMRSLVMSEAFQQSADVTAESLERDPDNRWLARGPRIRLDAEQIRDASLAASGLLNRQMGGPGFWGYQPPGIWEPVGYGDSNTRYYLRDSGDGIYRRSLYSFVKRTAPPPFMSNFDAPNREQFCTVRARSNTPLQALQLMNDVQHVEAARVLAARVMIAAGVQPQQRVDALFRTVLARYPDAWEQRELLDVLAQFQARYQADPDAAAALVAMGQSPPDSTFPATELAAYTLLANLILNLDEAITRN